MDSTNDRKAKEEKKPFTKRKQIVTTQKYLETKFLNNCMNLILLAENYTRLYPQYHGMGTWLCAVSKFGNRTHTHITCFGNTAGLTVPMAIPILIQVPFAHTAGNGVWSVIFEFF